jgi:Arm DNA-binding domain
MLDNRRAKETAAPARGSIMLWDESIPGLGLRIHSGGSKSFFINYRRDGRQMRYTIGPYPRWSVAAARERAKELRRKIDMGEDPAGEKRERREAPTVRDLIERYISEHLPTKARGNPARKSDDERMLAEVGRRLGMNVKV